MSPNDLFPDFSEEQYAAKRYKRKTPRKLETGPISRKRAAKLTMFENVHASKAHREDIVRAHALYHRTQEKLIKTKVTKLFFN